LIASRDSMVEASSANAQALAGVLTVLEHTKGKVDDLHEQWRRLSGVTSGQVAAVGVVGLATVATGGAAAGLLGPTFDATGNDAEKAKLTARAQAVMRDADTAAYAYLPRMVAPKTESGRGIWVPYDPGSVDGGPSSFAGRGSVHPPVIPPPAPAVVVSGSPQPTTGPVLASDPSGMSSRTPGLSDVGSAEIGPSGLAPASSWFVDTPRGRVLRSGGVIGMAPGQVESDVTDVARRTPVEQRDAGRVGGSAAEPVGGLLGSSPGVGRPADRRYQRRLPPETVWPVPRSVPGVLEPSPEQDVVHDPGPGVIGIDR
jgi:hypothetical protein